MKPARPANRLRLVLPRPPRRVLIIKPSSLGDIVHALPVLDQLRRAWPTAHIAWLIGKPFAGLLAGHRQIDELIPFDRARYGRIWRDPAAAADFARFVLSLRRRRFELVIDLQGLIRSAMLGVLSGARWRVGFTDAREGAVLFYSHKSGPAEGAQHAVDRNLFLLKTLDIDPQPPRFGLAVSADHRRTARQLLHAARKPDGSALIALVPGARWASKRWPVECWAELADRITDSHLGTCVLLGGPDERSLANRIAAAARTPIANLAGTTSLPELLAVIEQVDAVVCNDSGPMHLAAALDKPTVALFGPTNPARTGPYSPAARVLRIELDCSPCYRRACPLGHQRCLRDLGPQRVCEALAALLPAGCHAG